jgi:hypothetical protein
MCSSPSPPAATLVPERSHSFMLTSVMGGQSITPGGLGPFLHVDVCNQPTQLFCAAANCHSLMYVHIQVSMHGMKTRRTRSGLMTACIANSGTPWLERNVAIPTHPLPLLPSFLLHTLSQHALPKRRHALPPSKEVPRRFIACSEHAPLAVLHCSLVL